MGNHPICISRCNEESNRPRQNIKRKISQIKATETPEEKAFTVYSNNSTKRMQV